MTYDTSPASPQRIELSGRESLTVSGVEDVDRFDETEIDGRIDAIAFEDAPSSRGGLLSRLFGG